MTDIKFAATYEGNGMNPIDIKNVEVMLLTYRGWVLNTAYTQILDTKSEKIAFMNGCEEIGESGYQHTHLVIEFKAPERLKSARLYDIKNELGEIVHPNIKKGNVGRPTKTGTKKLKKDVVKDMMLYVCKDDIEKLRWVKENMKGSNEEETIGELGIDIITKIDTCKDFKESAGMLEPRGVRDTLDVLRLHQMIKEESTVLDMRESKSDIMKSEDMWLWQTRLEESIIKKYINMEPQDKSNHMREIIWIYDPVGGSGKSCFCKHMMDKYDKSWMYMSSITCVKDVCYNLSEVLGSGEWNGHGMFIDLTRKTSEYNVNASLEMIKNGRFNSTKYKSKNVSIDSPYVVIFSNSLPTHEQWEGFTEDRWQVYQIDDAMNILMLPYIIDNRGRRIGVKPIKCKRSAVRYEIKPRIFCEDAPVINEQYMEKLSKTFVMP